ncbi:dihydrofolate reductase [Roseibacillus ishigakijimensis]|uniref:Dihydrofolate reductase n=1 Tax=Roseibacillus ishigakijimensis TaxID=454146 RepID=A0A934RRI8_9BACT|nr:dihydrofolate reductase [Roseibacillus ishigakijimensis]MBK1833709.1 dihydrofolate reductase [Roseibacillus ishigakijimensis]
MKLIAIVAHDPNLLIGAGGELPWHLPADLAFFKKTTSGHPIVMGRKTYDSIGRPLPRRQNIVLTRDPSWTAEGVSVIHAPEDLTSLPLTLPGPVYLIGGAEIYRLFLPLTAEMLVTFVKTTHQGDTHLPPYEADFECAEIISERAEFEIRRYVRRKA